VIVPVVPIIPPRIRDPRPPRDPHRNPYPPGDRGTGKHDDGKYDGKNDGKSGSKTDHRDPGKATTTRTPGDDNRGKGKYDGRKPELSRTIQRRGGRDINANRIPDARALRGARNVDRIRNIDRIQSRDLPRINAPRDMQRIHAPRGGGLRMGGGPQFRGGGFGGGGGPRFRGGGFGGGGGGGGLRLR
jgi:hypothetical protein